jgi:hypothetical protein
VDQDFFTFLLNSNNLVGSLILNVELPKGYNYISPTDDHDKVTFLPDDKYDSSIEDPYVKGIGRSTIKIGRLIQKMVPKEILQTWGVNNHEIEKFVNCYKSWFDKSKFIFKIVEGEEIITWYNEENYYSPNNLKVGTIWNSCMRYVNRLKFLDLYTKNPNIKMLTLLQDVGGELKVRARALLWDDVNVLKDYSENLPDKIKIMDRIYTVFDSDVVTFKKWANENGYIPKFEQNAKSHQFFDIKGEVIRLKLGINLERKEFPHYPYLDTFPFLTFRKGLLTNDEYGSWDYKLVQANGNLEPDRSEDENYEEDDTW